MSETCQYWSAWLGQLILTRHDDGTTSLTRPVPDKAALYSLIGELRDLGISLISIQPLKSGADQDEKLKDTTPE